VFSVRFHSANSQLGPVVVAACRSLVLFYNRRRVETESSQVKDAAPNALAAAVPILILAGWINRHQQNAIEYLIAETNNSQGEIVCSGGLDGMLRFYYRKAA
jgi:hypothetical protein